jgi:hypothetical protein
VTRHERLEAVARKAEARLLEAERRALALRALPTAPLRQREIDRLLLQIGGDPEAKPRSRRYLGLRTIARLARRAEAKAREE